MKKTVLLCCVVTVLAFVVGVLAPLFLVKKHEMDITHMVKDHARAWETGDEALLNQLLNDDVVFAYPGRRLNKEQTLEDLRFFRDAYMDTHVYINSVIVDGDSVAVEWQFATTKRETGQREVVSDAIIAKVKDGTFISWKEYLDGRVKGMQAEGKLELEEGKEPFPWPLKVQTL